MTTLVWNALVSRLHSDGSSCQRSCNAEYMYRRGARGEVAVVNGGQGEDETGQKVQKAVRRGQER